MESIYKENSFVPKYIQHHTYYEETLPIMDWWRILEITMIEIWQDGYMD